MDCNDSSRYDERALKTFPTTSLNFSVESRKCILCDKSENFFWDQLLCSGKSIRFVLKKGAMSYVI